MRNPIHLKLVDHGSFAFVLLRHEETCIAHFSRFNRYRKSAFDRLPLYIIERFNSLIDDICAEGEGSNAADIPTGIADGHTLSALFSDLLNGETAKYLSLGKTSLSQYADENDEKIGEILNDLEICFRHINDTVTDAGSPTGRIALTGGVAI